MIQIIGRLGDKNTKKATMFYKERRIDFQFIDLDKKDLSKREWEAILSAVSSPEELIDSSSKIYKKEGYAYREYDPLEEVILKPELLRIPIVRDKNKVSVGLDMDFLKEIAKCNM